jgi:DNA-binding transcriptional MerR regulator
MEISVNQFAKEHGYTESTIKYYIKQGLMPKPTKRGGYGIGVNLFFDDADYVAGLLDRILELKKFGYKLSDIKDILEKEKANAETFQAPEYLQRQGRYYRVLDKIEKTRSEYCTSLSDLITPEFVKTYGLSKYCTPDELKKYAEEIEKRLLIVSLCLYEDKPVYDKYYYEFLDGLIRLHIQRRLTWEQLEALYKKHRKNINKYFYFPNDKSTGWLEYTKLEVMNSFCLILYDYFNSIDRQVKQMWDYCYPSVEEFYRDFTEGNCVFLPAAFAGDGVDMFLKKLK